MKILTVCQGGNVRSVALAYWLKSRGHDAIAIGVDHQRRDTLLVMTSWAETIMPVSEPVRARLLQLIPDCAPKIETVPIGEDRWGPNYHPELMGVIEALMRPSPFETRK